jgi:hypothetical protein
MQYGIVYHAAVACCCYHLNLSSIESRRDSASSSTSTLHSLYGRIKNSFRIKSSRTNGNIAPNIAAQIASKFTSNITQSHKRSHNRSQSFPIINIAPKITPCSQNHPLDSLFTFKC